MSTTPSSSFQPQGPDAYQTGGMPTGPAGAAPQPKQRNTLALVAFVAAVVGFIFAVWEGAYLLGWILLPIAFVLALVAMFGKDKPKKMAVWALVIAIVGTVAGAVAFMASAARIVDDAFGDSTPTVVASEPADPTDPAEPAETSAPEDQTSDEPLPEEATEEPADDGTGPDGAGLGTREAPLPLGTSIATDEWQVTVNSFTPDATDAILAENQFNEPPADGHTYAMANVTLTRVGAESGTAFEVSFSYITAGGNVTTSSDAMVVTPDDLPYDELFEGASLTGNVAFEIPADDAGVLRVTPGFFTDDAFFATS